MSIIIITDSCCDLPLTYVEANQDILEVLGMPVHINGEDYIDDLGQTLSHDTFYEYLRNGIMPSTSQINAYRFEEAFKRNIELGHEILYIGFTSGMSGTYNSSCVARTLIQEEYPDARIELVDTLSASIGQGAIIVEAIKRLRQGSDLLTLRDWVVDNKLNFNHWFGVDDLNYLKNGGRISAATAIVGNVLNVKPTLIVDHEGRLKTYGNVRGRKKSMAFLVSKLIEYCAEIESTSVIIGHGNCPEDANAVKELVLSKVKPAEIIISELSMTIASHVGPNMIAMAFLGEQRET